MKKFRITGIVQGVGFRPFIYRIAKQNSLKGWVLNDTKGVLTLVQGNEKAIAEFQQEIITLAPPMAVIASVQEEKIAAADFQREYTDFYILPSPQEGEKQVFLSPDIATCHDCIQELKNPADRRYNYPFINCTNCGPRYSIIKKIPYDRINTTMAEFVMCNKCQDEYENPADRRFHAQPDACSECGPQYWLKSNQGEIVQCEDVILKAKEFLQQGKIIAVKGIGGYHLASDAYNEKAVWELRKRKHREAKPLAIMTGSLALAKELCQVNEIEEKWLNSPVAPVVLLRKKEEADKLAFSVAPGNHYLGIMLPYAPVHHILLDENAALVMTSGNISHEPIAYKDDEAFKKLSHIADFFLGHNREIAYRVDDSVMRVISLPDGSYQPLIMRRSRGMAPAPLKFNNGNKSIFAAGAELKNTFCLTKNDISFVSEHIGDLENFAIYASYEKILEHYKDIFSIEPEVFVSDMHPMYFSTKFAEKAAAKSSIPLKQVQHHHAHIAAVLGEHNYKDKVIGIAWDGTGYGTDGAVWGGEFFIADCKAFQRKAYFRYLPLPGGDKAAKEPWRQALWCLKELYGDKAEEMADNLPDINSNWKLLLQAMKMGISMPMTSSAGRLFDTAAALLGICGRNSYEGQGAVMLELAACKAENKYAGKILPYDLRNDENGCIIIDVLPMFKFLIEEGQFGAKKEIVSELALNFHYTMADIILKTADKLRLETGINTAVLSGGVFQNRLLLEWVLKLLNKDYKVLLPKLLPINDGGLAFGQAVIADEILS